MALPVSFDFFFLRLGSDLATRRRAVNAIVCGERRTNRRRSTSLMRVTTGDFTGDFVDIVHQRFSLPGQFACPDDVCLVGRLIVWQHLVVDTKTHPAILKPFPSWMFGREGTAGVRWLRV